MNLDILRPFNTLPGINYVTPGVDYYGKFALNELVGDIAFEDVWTPGGIMTYFSDQRTIEIVSDSALDTAAGDGARTVEVWGLNDDYTPFRARVDLNGITPVVLPVQGMRIFRAFVFASGVQGVNVGNVTFTDQATAEVMAELPAGVTSSLMCQYTIPAGFTGFMSHFNVAAGQQNDATQIALLARPFGGSFLGIWGALGYRGNVENSHMYFVRLEERTDITVRAINITAGSVAVQTDFANTFIKHDRVDRIMNDYRAIDSVDMPWPIDPVV